MDADYQERPRDRTTSRRQNRWSMNSQRLEEIVAELMKPISDIRRSFDTDLSALLEEYLTEAGLHALEEGEAGEEDGENPPSPAGAAPNYAELALLLQHSACLYGRKVDFLYQHVLNVSDSLQNGTQEEASHEPGAAGAAAGAGGAGAAEARRRRRASAAAGGFARVALEAAAGARREPAAPRPPPTLPRMYIELEPRVLVDGDAPLHDYAGEAIGLPSDFHVIWRLQDGYLVDELEGPRASGESILNPISLVELQAAIEAAAPPSPPPLPSPLRERSPSPDADAPPLHASTPLPDRTPSPLKKQRKRRSDVKIDEIVGGRIKILISKELRRQLRTVQEFSVERRWISQVVERRKSRILAERQRLRAHAPRPPAAAFRGFDHSDADIGGFTGWSSTEVAAGVVAVAAVVAGVTVATREPDSDDDGFFEQSSLGDSDHSRVEELSAATGAAGAAGAGGAAGAAECGARALQVRALARGVLGAVGAAAERATPFAAVLQATVKQPADVSRILLATLFLANAGNVEILPGAPLTTGTFSVRLLSTDERLYCATTREHFQR